MPSEDFAEEGQETAVWGEDSAARPLEDATDEGRESAAAADSDAAPPSGQAPRVSGELIFDTDDFEEDLPTVARADSSAEVAISDEFDVELADMARKVQGADAGASQDEGPAGLSFTEDFEEDLPTIARAEITPPPSAAEVEHTEMLGDEEVNALAASAGEEGPPDQAGLVGHTFGGFRVVRKIAEGGMASVYLGRKSGPRGFAQHAALKVVHPHFAHQQSFVDMFLDEARIAALINHPSVCRVLDFGQARGTYFLAMEYVHGESWADVVTAMLAHPEAREHVWAVAAYVIGQACEGLYAAHQSTDEAGRALCVVHRDVSPQNIFVAYDGTVRVLDFGIASAADRLTTTRTGTVKGRLSYMAPEQMRGEDVDQRADIWSLGVMLREALEGRRLFRRRSEAESMMAVVSEPLPEWEPHVPEELRAIADRALSRDREQRFDTCRDMGRALNHYLATHASALSSAEVSGWVASLFSERMAQKRRWLQQPAPEPVEVGRASGFVRRSGTPTDITAAQSDGLLGELEREPGGGQGGRYAPTLKLETTQAPKRGRSPWLWVGLTASLLGLAALGVAFVQRSGQPGALLPSLGLMQGARDGVGTDGIPTVPAPPPAVADDTPGVLVVEYQGGWADVYVDGHKVGKTPLRHELPPGRVIVELQPFGTPPAVKHPMKFAPGQTQKLRIQPRAPEDSETPGSD